MRSTRLPALLLHALLAASSRAAAQGVVVGSVADSATGSPVAGAEIMTAGTVVARTDGTGRFTLRLPAGFHDVAARSIGFQPAGQRIQLTDGDTTTIRFRLSGAQRLPTLITNVAGPARGGLAGFEARRRDETGAFITEEMLNGQEHRPLSNALGALVAGARFTHYENETIITGRGGCAMAVWVDGLRVFAGTPRAIGGALPRAGSGRRPQTGLSISSASNDGPPNIDNWKITDIAAVEVYVGPARTPVAYQLTGSDCGTMLIWTKTGAH